MTTYAPVAALLLVLAIGWLAIIVAAARLTSAGARHLPPETPGDWRDGGGL